MSCTLALDVGGTHMRVAVFLEGQTTPFRQSRIRTNAPGENSLDRLMQLIRDVAPVGERIQTVGIAVPGPIDSEKGVIVTAPNLPSWVGVPIADQITESFGAPAILGNDANLAAIGEWRYGAGRGHHHLVYLTISTGIGGGVISNDQLLLGSQGFAGELGHVTILPDGPLCSCGQRGHLEAISAGPGISAFVKDQMSRGKPTSLKGAPNAETISHAAVSGDTLAREAFERAGYYLGLAIANYLMIFNPSMIILGGGVSQVGELLLAPVRQAVRQSVLSEFYLQNLTITQAALGDDAGLYGALTVARGLLS